MRGPMIEQLTVSQEEYDLLCKIGGHTIVDVKLAKLLERRCRYEIERR